MNIKLTALAASTIGALLIATAPAMANDASTSSTAITTYENGYQTTQGRRVGARRGGGVVVVPRRRNNAGRNIAIGVGAAVLGAAILSQSARAQGGGNSCRRWSYQCNDGARWACRNFDRYC